MKNIRIFVSENFQVFGGESFYILNRRAFVMVYFPVFCFFLSEFSIVNYTLAKKGTSGMQKKNKNFIVYNTFKNIYAAKINKNHLLVGNYK